MRLKTIIILLISTSIIAENSLFEQANNEYRNQNYSIAISLYDSILNNGLESGELYYNLGNCYYKNQDWANAIWHYEKSLIFKKEKKVLKNLNLTKQKIKDKIEPLPEIFYKKWWLKIVELFKIKTWQTFTLISLWSLLFFKIFEFIKKIRIRYVARTLITLSLFFFLITYSAYNNIYNKEHAIIFVNSTIVNSAPSNSSTILFSLHSGTKVEIIEKIGNWLNVKIENGNTGWVEGSKCKML